MGNTNCPYCQWLFVDGVYTSYMIKENIEIFKQTDWQGQKLNTRWYMRFKNAKRKWDKVQIHYCPICR